MDQVRAGAGRTPSVDRAGGAVPLAERFRHLLRKAGRGTARGIGPLLQRDYWAVIEGCRLPPSETVDWVARRFAEFAPEELVVFEREAGRSGPLEIGEELEVRIRMAGTARVRVLDRSRASFTLGTLPGHPEAGRITFGAYRNRRNDVIFHIRSRARSRGRREYAGFLALGDPMQTTTWTDFVNRVAVTTGRGVLAFVHAETRLALDEDDTHASGPTYIAQAD